VSNGDYFTFEIIFENLFYLFSISIGCGSLFTRLHLLLQPWLINALFLYPHRRYSIDFDCPHFGINCTFQPNYTTENSLQCNSNNRRHFPFQRQNTRTNWQGSDFHFTHTFHGCSDNHNLVKSKPRPIVTKS